MGSMYNRPSFTKKKYDNRLIIRVVINKRNKLIDAFVEIH